MSSLWPVEGTPRALLEELSGWLGKGDATLTIATSGTTGQPKLVCLSARALVASASATLARIGGPGQWLLAVSPERIAGLQVLVRSLLAGQTPTVLAEHDGFPAAARAMRAERRYTALVPTQLHRLLAEGHVEVLQGFDAVLVGGAAADPLLVDRAVSSGVAVVTTYGMTETCGGCVYDGVPLDGVKVALDEESRILLRGPVLFDGYLDRADLTAEVLRDGWLVTPDVGRLDDAGRLHLLGRADDVVVSGGVNVAASAVESRLRQHDTVRDATVLGVPDPEWGHRVVAFVVAPDRPPTLSELRDFVAMRLPRSWAPRELVVVPELPVLPSGKLDVHTLRDSVGVSR
jgi:o-succinylbenzoate---CoA ligase